MEKTFAIKFLAKGGKRLADSLRATEQAALTLDKALVGIHGPDQKANANLARLTAAARRGGQAVNLAGNKWNLAAGQMQAAGRQAKALASRHEKLASATKAMDPAEQISQYRSLKRELKEVKLATRLGGEAGTDAKRAWREKALQLRALSAGLKKAGIDTRNLARHERQLADQARKAAARLEAQARATAKITAGRQMRQSALSEATGVIAPALALAAPLKQAIGFESAMADVRKVMNFPEPDGLKKLAKRLLVLSARDIPLSAKGLAQIAAAGGQLGVKAKNIEPFIVTTAKMAVAFDMTADEAGDASAKLANVFNLPVTRVERLGDAINHLSDNTAAKAREIVRAMLRVGGISKEFGLTAVQTSALTGAFVALGKPPEVAGTAVNGLLTKLMIADKAGKKAKAALAALGLKASQLKYDIGKDAQGALLNFLEAVSKMPKADRMGILVDMFGAEYADDISTLTGSLDKYRQALKLVGREGNYAGSMQKEFANRSATTQNNLQLLANKANQAAINFGTVLLPALNSEASAMGWVSDTLANLQERFPLVTGAVTKTTAAVLALVVGFKAAKMAGKFLGGGFKEISGLFGKLRAGRAGKRGLANGGGSGLGSGGEAAGGLAAGLSGATPVFVTNWPSGGLGGVDLGGGGRGPQGKGPAGGKGAGRPGPPGSGPGGWQGVAFQGRRQAGRWGWGIGRPGRRAWQERPGQTGRQGPWQNRRQSRFEIPGQENSRGGLVGRWGLCG